MAFKDDYTHISNFTHGQRYQQYLSSSHWKSVRQFALALNRARCQKCGVSDRKRPMNVNHLHYRTIGRESPSDVMVLCDICHAIEHGIAANDPQYDLFDEAESP